MIIDQRILQHLQFSLTVHRNAKCFLLASRGRQISISAFQTQRKEQSQVSKSRHINSSSLFKPGVLQYFISELEISSLNKIDFIKVPLGIK